MVKVEERTTDRKTLEDRCDFLRVYAEGIFKKSAGYTVERDLVLGSVQVWVSKGYGQNLAASISAFADNTLSVRDEAHFQEALRLAEMYEAETKQEFTLRKDYRS